MNHIVSRATTLLLTIFASGAWAEGTVPVVCIAPPKAQLGQGNNSGTDVSEPVRTALSQYMAGPSIQLVPLEARIPVQIEAEAAQKNCNFVLITSVTQTKKTSKMGFLKTLAPLASAALPMLGGMGGDVSGMMAGQVASSVMSASATASAESMQQDYMAAMMGAQQTNVKAGDTLTVEYSLSATDSVGAKEPESLQSKAKQDGEDVIGPLLEQVAVAVLSVVTAA